MKITRRDDATPNAANPDWFTGAVTAARHDADEPGARLAMAIVAFPPGARTNWHTHPTGQTLVVTEGEGWVRTEGGAKETVRVGDVVRFAPGVRHWHGATADSPMTHVAVSEAVDGVSVDWSEPVSDDDYSAP
ncbi:cupin domain-containing protein [Rhodobacteraceae bacterium CCMM004]|nr:cupin domain-containing protein [Rhodobacteraceae bacterium CCMM004]